MCKFISGTYLLKCGGNTYNISLQQEKNHVLEIQRLKKESDELNHRVSYLHKTLQERETKLEQQEGELVRLMSRSFVK